MQWALVSASVCVSLGACSSDADEGADLAAQACGNWSQQPRSDESQDEFLGRFTEAADLASEASRHDSQWHYLADALITFEEYMTDSFRTTPTADATQEWIDAMDKITRECRKVSG
jgi:hypothetical protein